MLEKPVKCLYINAGAPDLLAYILVKSQDIPLGSVSPPCKKESDIVAENPVNRFTSFLLGIVSVFSKILTPSQVTAEPCSPSVAILTEIVALNPEKCLYILSLA